MAPANRNYIGLVLDVPKDLTVVEEVMIARSGTRIDTHYT